MDNICTCRWNKWATGLAGEFLIRITRTRNSLTTAPIEDLVQIAAGSLYEWTDAGDAHVRTLQLDDGVVAPGATVGQAKLYVDTADGDLKVIFGDGTIKTIATD